MSNRTKIKAPPVTRGMLAGTLEEYHERCIVPALVRQDLWVRALAAAVAVEAVVITALLVRG